MRELDRLRDRGVTADEVDRARALVETEFTTSLQSAADRADKLSQFATYFGDPSLINTQVDRYRAVTAEAVTAFAREWLGRDNRATLVYVPRESTSEEVELAGTVAAGA